MKKEDKIMLEEIKNNIPDEQKWSVRTTWVLGIFISIWLLVLLNIIPSDYNILFFILSVITGFYWIKEKKSWKQYLRKSEDKEWIRPWWLSWTAGIFPIVIVVFLVRGFVVEPFKVPTGSMIPNIMIGEITVTNKVYYDFKIPVLEKSLFKIRDVTRGDVVVFRYPPNPMIYYVKRFVGLPGDTIEYIYADKSLRLNGSEILRKPVANFTAGGKSVEEYQEDLNGVKHSIWIEPASSNYPDPGKVSFPLQSNCEYTQVKMKCIVPANHYFAIGDNRDNSADSRYWGFIPYENIVGKAQAIAFSPVELSRIGWIK